MSFPQPLDKYQEVVSYVNQALGSREKSQLKFASVRALDAYQVTGELIYFTMYAECQIRINSQKGYHVFRKFIAENQLRPNPSDPQNAEFFIFFAAHLLLNSDFDPDKDLKKEALQLVKPLITHWDALPRREYLLHILLENHEIALVEELAYRWLNEERYFATLFLMHVSLVQNDMVSAFNYFCDLLALLGPDINPDINSFEELSVLIEQTHYMFGIYSSQETNIKKPDPHSLTYSNIDDSAPDAGVIFNNILKFGVFICKMLDDQQAPVPQVEMDLEELSDSWQHHHFGFRNVPEREQGEIGLMASYDISIDPDSGDIASAAIN